MVPACVVRQARGCGAEAWRRQSVAHPRPRNPQPHKRHPQAWSETGWQAEMTWHYVPAEGSLSWSARAGGSDNTQDCRAVHQMRLMQQRAVRTQVQRQVQPLGAEIETHGMQQTEQGQVRKVMLQE